MDVGIGVQSILSLAPGESGSFATRTEFDPDVLPGENITILGIVAEPAVLPLTLFASTRVDLNVPVDGCGICEIKAVTSVDTEFSVVLVRVLTPVAADSSGSFHVEVECTAPDGTATTSVVTVETDSDGDGTGDSLDPCTGLNGDRYSIGDACAGLDCDENNADINAGAVDDCYDGIDSDCQQDDDFDGDGFVPSDVSYQRDLPNGDGDGTDPNFAPDVVDDCYDGVDQNCDGADGHNCDGDDSVSPDIHYDGPLPQHDGYDGEADIFAGAEDFCYDGIDSDCGDLLIPTSDGDGDGHVPTDYAGPLPVDDDNNEDASVFTGAEEVPYDDIDHDCTDGDLCNVDEDDSLAPECDGDDTPDAFGTNAIDIPSDGIDQDCSGDDETLPDLDSGTDDGFVAGGCDCSSSGSPAAVWMGSLLVGLLLLRRRR
jgi:MYXO-CTERM domain-containing protein